MIISTDHEILFCVGYFHMFSTVYNSNIYICLAGWLTSSVSWLNYNYGWFYMVLHILIVKQLNPYISESMESMDS